MCRPCSETLCILVFVPNTNVEHCVWRDLHRSSSSQHPGGLTVTVWCLASVVIGILLPDSHPARLPDSPPFLHSVGAHHPSPLASHTSLLQQSARLFKLHKHSVSESPTPTADEWHFVLQDCERQHCILTAGELHVCVCSHTYISISECLSTYYLNNY